MKGSRPPSNTSSSKKAIQGTKPVENSPPSQRSPSSQASNIPDRNPNFQRHSNYTQSPPSLGQPNNMPPQHSHGGRGGSRPQARPSISAQSFKDYGTRPVAPPKSQSRRGGWHRQSSNPHHSSPARNQPLRVASVGSAGSANSAGQQTPQASPASLPSPREIPTQPRNMPIRNTSGAWRQAHSIIVHLKNIPYKFTLLDLFNVFSPYGEIEFMELFDKGGIRNGEGRLRFCPPPRFAFWADLAVKGELNDIKYTIVCILGNPSIAPTVENPVTKLQMPAILAFEASSLDFGFMQQEDSMVAMFTTRKEFPVKFEINFNKRIIDVFFKHRFEPTDEDFLAIKHARDQWINSHPDSPEAAQAKLNKGDGSDFQPREEEYRFQIPFEQLSKLAEQNVSSINTRVFVAPLQSPPQFYRKLGNMRYSLEEADQRHWSNWHGWIRQTDIMPFALLLQDYPISLQKKMCTIDIGRWTTYRLTFKLGKLNTSEKLQDMIRYLNDFNVNTEFLDVFQIISHRPKAVWDLIDAPLGSELHFTIPHLDFPVRYQLEAAISHGCLNEYSIRPEFIQELLKIGQKRAIALLEHVTEKRIRRWDPMDIFELQDVYGFTGRAKLGPESAFVRRVTVTPTTVIYNTPSVEITNRILRRYQEHADRFIRVHFADERKKKLQHNGRMAQDEVLTRVYRALERGITIGDRHYEFLAFGSSQFREHGAYMFAPTPYLSTDEIRNWMGNFDDIKVVAKYCARLGQCFSTSYAIKTVRVDVKEICDIKRNGYTFTDGVGKISECAASLIVADLDWKLPQTPSAFQFRLGGCKGVLTVWPDVSGREVLIRPSQMKFPAKHDVLEIIRRSQFAHATLNRQLIHVLCALGTREGIFERMLRSQLADLNEAMTNASVAMELLTKWIDENQMTLRLAGMIQDGFMDANEPFIMNLLRLWRAWKMRSFKEKARLDVENGAFLIGVVDEAGVLKGHFENQLNPNTEQKEEDLPEIFVQISTAKNLSQCRIVEGICLIARNPSLHPGDIRKVRAVDKPELRHLRDVLVLPQTGDRDLGNMCSGGDLDGDDYVVIWDKEIICGLVSHEPMDYTADPPDKVNRQITVEDMITFFVNYMKNDRLGTIANNHVAWGDYLDDGILNPKCIELCHLHSMAVDYPKSGQPATLPRRLRIRSYPHFMQKEPDKTYHSEKILGRLYDMVQKVDFQPLYTKTFDPRLLRYPVSRKLLLSARSMKIDYDVNMRRTMAQYDIKTEFEVYSTFVMSFNSEGKNHYTFHEEIIKAKDALSERFRGMVYRKLKSRDNYAVGIFAAAIYKVTHLEVCEALDISQPDVKGKKPLGPESLEATDSTKHMPLISFAWLFRDLLGKLANGERPFNGVSSQTELDIPTWSEGGELETEDDYQELNMDIEGAAGLASTENGQDTQDGQDYDDSQDASSSEDSGDDKDDGNCDDVEDTLGNGNVDSTGGDIQAVDFGYYEEDSSGSGSSVMGGDDNEGIDADDEEDGDSDFGEVYKDDNSDDEGDDASNSLHAAPDNDMDRALVGTGIPEDCNSYFFSDAEDAELKGGAESSKNEIANKHGDKGDIGRADQGQRSDQETWLVQFD